MGDLFAAKSRRIKGMQDPSRKNFCKQLKIAPRTKSKSTDAARPYVKTYTCPIHIRCRVIPRKLVVRNTLKLII